MLPRKRCAPSRYEVGTGEAQHPSAARDYYRGLYIEALDCLTSAIKERFNQPAFLVYKKRDEAQVTRDEESLNVHERELIGQVVRICKLSLKALERYHTGYIGCEQDTNTSGRVIILHPSGYTSFA